MPLNSGGDTVRHRGRKHQANSPSLSFFPDGTHLVYVTSGSSGSDRIALMLRNLAESDARLMAGTSTLGNVGLPTFSPPRTDCAISQKRLEETIRSRRTVPIP